MSDKTAIQWTNATWNPVTGCTHVSPGCDHCYAERLMPRLRGSKDFSVELYPDRLEQPLHWRKPRRIFVNSLSDLWHRDIPDQFIAAVFGVMALCPQHTFQILTKRPDRAEEWFKDLAGNIADCLASAAVERPDVYRKPLGKEEARAIVDLGWPLPNVWVGVSAENQAMAKARLPVLARIPAAVRFVSAEPLLERLDLDLQGVGWLIVGGESGPQARPCNVAWIRDVVRQCWEAGVACFVKQLGSCVVGESGHDWYLRDSHGGNPAEWPEDLRVREFPKP